jgi:ATP-dependent helicase/nuclease subunit B
VIRARQSWSHAPAYEGVLGAADILADLRERFGAKHSWSASRLNRYGNCPYGFFAQHVLKLDEQSEPEEGMDVMQRGSLLHGILEHLHRRLVEENLALSAEMQETVLRYLDETCEAQFRRAPARLGFRPTALWKHEQAEMKRLLTALVTWECQSESAYQPHLQEFRFGVRGAEHPSQPIHNRAGESILFHGVIDRIDRAANGQLRVLDYKSGSSPYTTKEMEEGRALQNPLYALVAAGILQNPVGSAAYLRLPKRDLSGKLEFDGGIPANNATVQAAVEIAHEFVARIRGGFFPALPAKPTGRALTCSATCGLAHLCRITRTSIAKAKRMETPNAN